MNFCKTPAGNAMQQLDESKEAQLSICMPDPVMENCMYGYRGAKAKFLKQKRQKDMNIGSSD